jgi:NADH pyrophosphatase NudC (nudix superfamily)
MDDETQIKYAVVTLEWHWYCPYCERSCHSRFNKSFDDFSIICSDCKNEYFVTFSAKKATKNDYWRGCDK